jgi:hypothetical protein
VEWSLHVSALASHRTFSVTGNLGKQVLTTEAETFSETFAIYSLQAQLVACKGFTAFNGHKNFKQKKIHALKGKAVYLTVRKYIIYALPLYVSVIYKKV